MRITRRLTTSLVALVAAACLLPVSGASAWNYNPWTSTEATNAMWTNINGYCIASASPPWSCYDVDVTVQAGGGSGYTWVSWTTFCQATQAGGRRAYEIGLGVKNGNPQIFQFSATPINSQLPHVCGP